jgi:hypothetical protein
MCRCATSTLRSCSCTLHISFLSALRLDGRRAHFAMCVPRVVKQPRDILHHQVSNRCCGFVHIRVSLHASLLPPLYEPTRSSARPQQFRPRSDRGRHAALQSSEPPIHLQMQGTDLLDQMMRSKGCTRGGENPINE